LPAERPSGILFLDLQPVVGAADEAETEEGEEGDPGEGIADVLPENHRNGDGNDDENAAHGRGARLDKVTFRPVQAHRLTELEDFEFFDDQGAQEKHEKKGAHRRVDGTEGQVTENIEGGKIFD
jgi:hypothetical protein